MPYLPPDHPKRARNREIYRRATEGVPTNQLAAEYGLSRVSIWSICKDPANHTPDTDLPPIEDRNHWRKMLAVAYAERLADAHDQDTGSFVKLAKGLRELGGLDFKTDLEAQLVKIEAQKLHMLTEALAHAMGQAALTPEQRAALGEALDNRLAELEITA